MTGPGDPIASRKLGPYVLGRMLGTGGMATVYAARQDSAHVKRMVALKVLASAIIPDDIHHQSFMREALVATRLEHPNIVRTYDVGEIDGRMYLAMELVHGAALSTCQAKAIAPTPVGIAVRIVSDVARALHAAHELSDPERGHLGFVHQDVSPQNVLIGYDGIVKLVDFGVARLASIEGSRTETVRGKPSYLSPEQVNGKNIDRKTDVFALGVVLWELLAGTRLFKRDTAAATYMAVLNDPILDVTTVNPDVPPLIADVLAVALQRERSERFDTAEAFRKALASARTSSSVADVSQEELASWVGRLVPATLAPADLEREITNDPSRVLSVVPGATPERTSVDVIEAVPELDVPRRASSARMAAAVPATSKPAPAPSPSFVVPALDLPKPGEMRASDPSLRAAPVASAAPPPPARASTPSHAGTGGRELAFDDDDDDDMEIERGGHNMPMATSATSPRTSGVPAPARMSGAPRPSLELDAPSRMARERAASRDDAEEPGGRAKVVGLLLATAVTGATGFALSRYAHRAGGFDVASALPHAFDGSSATESGVVSLAALVIAVTIAFVGLRLKPHAWAIVAAGGALLLLSLAMVTVTLASTGENPTPPDGVLLVPYLFPLAVLLLALGLAGRSGRLFALGGGARRAAFVPLAAIAGILAFLAIETSPFAR